MINWLSDHDETSLDGSVVRVRVGTPDQTFWDEWKGNKETWAKKGFSVFEAKGEFFVKAPSAVIVVPPAMDVPCPKPPAFLRSYQKKHFPNLWDCLTAYTACFDGSDTGTGKTWVNLAICLELGLTPFVVCPLAAIAVWRSVIKRLGMKTYGVGNYEYFKGENPFGDMEMVYFPGRIYHAFTGQMPRFPKHKSFSEYDKALDFLYTATPLRPQHLKHWEGKHGKSFRKISRQIRGYNWNLPKDAAFIFDEVHRCKAEDSQNMRLLAAAKPYIALSLSATPGISPRDFKALGYMLGLHRLYDFDLWTKHHGCSRNHWNSWEYKEKSLGMESLSKEIYPAHGARMRISEIPDFPKTNIIAESYTAKEASAYRKAYKECLERCEQLNSEGENKILIISAIQKYRQAAEMLKVPLLCTLINEQLEAGFSVCVFVNYRETLARLSDEYKNPPVVYGGQKFDERNNAVKAFQKDEARLIILNMQAGSVAISLHDERGKYPRYSLISPTYNPYDLKQVFGRVHRDGAKSISQQRLIYMAETIEEEVCERVQTKIQAFGVLHGDLQAEELAEPEVSKLLSPRELESVST